MREMKGLLFLVGLSWLLSALPLASAYADDDEHDSGKGFGAVDNATYKEQCGTCHFSYQPGFLPSGSWDKILSGLDDHNGESIDIEEADLEIIRSYLRNNAADYSSARRARKIMRSLDGKTPERITEVPYIRHKHHEVPQEVFARQSIGSLSNCAACHFTADAGIYDDDYVRIPK